MKVSATTVFALALCLSTVQGTAPTMKSTYVLKYVTEADDGNNWQVSPEDNLSCTDEVIKARAAEPTPMVCLDSGAFTKEVHFKELNLTPPTTELLYRYASGVLDGEPKDIEPDFATLKKIMEKAKNIGNVVSDGNTYLQRLYRHLPTTFFKDNNVSLFGITTKADYLKDLLEKMAASSISLIKDNKADILSRMVAIEPPLEMKKLSKEVQKALLGPEDGCKGLGKPHLDGFNSESFSHFTYGCISQIEKLEDLIMDIRIRHIPVEIFKKSIQLHPDAYQYLTVAQFSALHSDKTEEHDSGKNLPLDERLRANAANMSPAFFAVALNNHANTTIRRSFESLPENILSAVTDADDLKKLEDDWKFISKAQKKHLFVSGKCESLPDKILDYHGEIDIDAECFEKLSSVNKVQALIHANLPDDALAKLGASDFSGLESEEYKDIGVLQAAAHRKNIKALVENLSRDASDHACSLIDSVDRLKELKVIQHYGSEKCFADLGVKPSTADFKDLDPRIHDMLTNEEHVTSMEAKDYEHLDETLFARLESKYNLCATMPESGFKHLSDKIIETFPATCLVKLTFLGDLSKSDIQKLPATAFTNMTADAMGKINHANLTDAQFGTAGSAVTDKAQHPASQWTKDTVAGFSTSRISAIHKSAWEAAKPEAYAGLTGTTFPAIPADAMVGMTHEQFFQVPEDARAKITVAQADQVGNAVTSGTSPLEAFANLAGLSDDVRAAIQKRMPTPAPAPAAKE